MMLLFVSTCFSLDNTQSMVSEKEKFNKLLTQAKAGDLQSQYDLSIIYMFDTYSINENIDEAPDYKSAFSWLSKSAEKNYSKSQYMLANLYELGKGTKKDYNKAIFWYKKAVDNGNKDAICPLAKLYTKSGIHPKDPEISRKCLMK